MSKRIEDLNANKIDSREAYGVLIAATVACAACLDDYNGEIEQLNAISRRIEDRPDGSVRQTLGAMDVQVFLRELISKLKVTCVEIGSPPPSRPSRERDAAPRQSRGPQLDNKRSAAPRQSRGPQPDTKRSAAPRQSRGPRTDIKMIDGIEYEDWSLGAEDQEEQDREARQERLRNAPSAAIPSRRAHEIAVDAGRPRMSHVDAGHLRVNTAYVGQKPVSHVDVGRLRVSHVDAGHLCTDPVYVGQKPETAVDGACRTYPDSPSSCASRQPSGAGRRTARRRARSRRRARRR
jgi:hypothetical protein